MSALYEACKRMNKPHAQGLGRRVLALACITDAVRGLEDVGLEDVGVMEAEWISPARIMLNA